MCTRCYVKRRLTFRSCAFPLGASQRGTLYFYYNPVPPHLLAELLYEYSTRSASSQVGYSTVFVLTCVVFVFFRLILFFFSFSV